MAELQDKFVYDDDSLQVLANSISVERLKAFMDFAENDLRYAIALYEWNARISESLYTLIHGLEVTLRNSIHREMCAHWHCQRWYDHCDLQEAERRQLDKTKQRLRTERKDLSPGRIVAGLNFGFWTGLTEPGYARNLWDRALYRCLAQRSLSRTKFSRRLTTIRLLRNRIAHFESIIGKREKPRRLAVDAQRIIEAISWICPVTSRWVAAKSTFDATLNSRPKPPDANPDLFTAHQSSGASAAQPN